MVKYKTASDFQTQELLVDFLEAIYVMEFCMSNGK